MRNSCVSTHVKRYHRHLTLTAMLVVMHVYPGICTFTAAVLALMAAYDMISSWQQTVRDKEFLMELRLQNLEVDQEGKVKMEESDMTPMEEEEEE